MPMLRVSHGAMESGAGALTTALNQLTALLEDLKAKNNALTDANVWYGCGSEDYRNLANKFYNDATNLVQDLKPLADYVSSSNENYMTVSNHARSRFL